MHDSQTSKIKSKARSYSRKAMILALWGIGHLVFAIIISSVVLKLCFRSICDSDAVALTWIVCFALSLAITNGVRSFVKSKRFFFPILCGIFFFFGTYFLVSVLFFMFGGAFGRGRQSRTMLNMREIGAIVETIQRKNGRFPKLYSLEELQRITDKKVPTRDGWNHPFRFQSDGVSYVIISPAQCGVFETEIRETYEIRQTTSFEDDIVFRNGRFVHYPEGTQD